MSNSLNDIPGLFVGHVTDDAHGSGCTVVLCPEGMRASCAVRGGAPGSRESDLLHPQAGPDKVTAVVFSGGSAWGLTVAQGVMEYCHEHHLGCHTPQEIVPIVPAFILYDLEVGTAYHPPSAWGYQACEDALSSSGLCHGNIGAGCGASIGKSAGMTHAMKSGLSCITLEHQSIKVSVLVVLNALGDIIDQGRIIAGCQPLVGKTPSAEMYWHTDFHKYRNTTLALVATDAHLSKTELHQVSQLVHNAFATHIYPVHTPADGDAIVSVSTGSKKATMTQVALLAQQACQQAILQAIRVPSAYNLPGYGDT